MDLLTASIIGAGLSADCFAVAVTITSMRRIRLSEHITIPLHFGFFHTAMILIGFYLGVAFESVISRFDHWLASLLLFFIGGRIIYHALRGEEGSAKIKSERDLLAISLATSIDALILGIALSIINGDIISTSLVIGAIVAAISFVGLEVGERIKKLGVKYVEFVGGAVLIGIGLKVLIDHIL